MKKEQSAKPEKKKVQLHAGHRQRMLEKLNRGILCEHELLEVLLFFAIPRQNTNDIAHRLLLEFGTLQNVFSATADELASVEGMGKNSAGFLQCLGEVLKLCEKATENAFPQTFEPAFFEAYLHREYALLTDELLDVYMLDANGKIFMRSRYEHSSSSNIRFPMKWLQKVLVDNAPSGIILVHNHPSGDSTPSSADDFATEQCQEICLSSSILFCDHYICNENGVHSYYQSGALKEIAKACIQRSRDKQKKIQSGEL